GARSWVPRSGTASRRCSRSPSAASGGAADMSGDAESRATELRCIECGAVYPLDYRLECARCAGLLELQYDWDSLAKAGPALFGGSGLWRYAPVLPIADPSHRVTLGEGPSPLL